MLTTVGPWKLGEWLGSGGVADVYAATRERGDTTVALKVLRPRAAAVPQIREAFAREALLSRRLRHPNLIPLLAAGLRHDPPWLAFEFVDGLSLAAVLAAAGPLSPAAALNVMVDAACGLAAAHARGVLHCDLKPENVLIAPDGRARLADLGAASYDPFLDPRMQREFTVAGPLEGRAWPITLPYASPEQLLGKELDPSSDLYSLGLVLYEAMTGLQVNRADDPLDALVRLRRLPGELRPLAALCPGLTPLLDHLLTGLLPFRREERRFRTAIALLAELDWLLSAPGLAPPVRGVVQERTRVVQGDGGSWRTGPGLRGWPGVPRAC